MPLKKAMSKNFLWGFIFMANKTPEAYACSEIIPVKQDGRALYIPDIVLCTYTELPSKATRAYHTKNCTFPRCTAIGNTTTCSNVPYIALYT